LTRSKYESDPSLTWVLYDPTRRDFFYPKGKKMKNLRFLGEIFRLKPKMADPTQHEQQKLTLPDPGQKKF